MIRLALIGRDAALKYQAISRRLRGAAIVAVVDPDLGNARKTAGALDASIFAGSLDDLLAQSSHEFDAVVVDSTNTSHAALVEKSAGAGKHMLVEMPLAQSIQEADAAIDACRAAGVRLMVGQAMRFVPSHQKVKDSIASGKLGALGLLRIHHWGPLGADGWDWLSPAAGPTGGTVINRVIRHIDLAVWLFETLPTEVYAVGRQRNPGLDLEDYVQVHLGFPEGAMALIDYSMTLPRGADYFSLSVIGSSGGAYADDHHNMNLLYRGGHPLALDIGQGQVHILDQLQEFINAIEEDREPAITGADGRAAVQAAQAVRLSIATGAAVRLEEGRYERV